MLEAPLKNGNGKELCHLLDVVKQPMRVLKAMKCKSLCTFILSAVELKLDQSLMFVWQNLSHHDKEVPLHTTYWNF